MLKLHPIRLLTVMRWFQGALLVVLAGFTQLASSNPLSPERRATIDALSRALASAVHVNDQQALNKTLSALHHDSLTIAVIFDEDLTPIAHVGLSDAFQIESDGEALSDPVSLWAAELNSIQSNSFSVNNANVTATAAPINFGDRKIASLLIVEQSSTPAPVSAQPHSFIQPIHIGLFLLLGVIFGVFSFYQFRKYRKLTKVLNQFIDQGLYCNRPTKAPGETATSGVTNKIAHHFASALHIRSEANRLFRQLSKSSSYSIIENVALSIASEAFNAGALYLSADRQCLAGSQKAELQLGASKYAFMELNEAIAQCNDIQTSCPITLGHQSYYLTGAPVNCANSNIAQLVLITVKPLSSNELQGFAEYCQGLNTLFNLAVKQASFTSNIEALNKKFNQEHLLRLESQEWTQKLTSLSQKGFAFIGSDSRFIGVASHSFGRIFGCESIAGKSVNDVIFQRCQLPHEQIRQAIAAIELMLESDVLMFEFNKNKLPHKLTLVNQDGTRDELIMHWHAIAEDGAVKQLYIEVASIAREIALEAQVKALQQEVELIGQVLKAPADAFGQFIMAVTEALDTIGSLLKGSAAAITQEQALNIYQSVHKLKRESRRLGLAQVTQALYQMELLVDTSHRAESEYATSIEVLSAVQEVKHALHRYQHVDENILMRSESADQKGLSIKQVHIIRSQIKALQGPIGASDKQKIDQISGLLTKASYTTLSHVLNYIGSHCEDIAINLGKAPPVMHLDADELWMADDAVRQVKDHLMQLVNHIICHSIETIPERAKANKPPAGQIYVSYSIRGDQIELTCNNDGKGIPTERLARYQVTSESNATIDAQALLSAAEPSRGAKSKPSQRTLPFEIRFSAAIVENFQSYEGVLSVPRALCWYDSVAQSAASTG